MKRVACPWCLSDACEEWSDRLCPRHLAEYMGLSVAELDRMDSELAEEEWWSRH